MTPSLRGRSLALALLLLGASLQGVEARTTRSQVVLKQFQKIHPCPSTGLTYGKCPGYVKDHVTALACGGDDAVDNLQWQTIAEAKAKDRIERVGCQKGGMKLGQDSPGLPQK